MHDQHKVEIHAPAGEWSTIDDLSQVVTEAVRRAVEAGGVVHPCDVCVVLSDDRELHILNRDYRKIDKPTNVLAFPQDSLEEEDDNSFTIREKRFNLGDILISYETLLREAEEQGKAPRDHLAHLLIHGVLHLSGYDHEKDSDADAMEAKERVILADMGIADPYDDEGPDADVKRGRDSIAAATAEMRAAATAIRAGSDRPPPGTKKSAAKKFPAKKPATEKSAAKTAPAKKPAAKSRTAKAGRKR